MIDKESVEELVEILIRAYPVLKAYLILAGGKAGLVETLLSKKVLVRELQHWVDRNGRTRSKGSNS